jgi:hypothetical protein
VKVDAEAHTSFGNPPGGFQGTLWALVGDVEHISGLLASWFVEYPQPDVFHAAVLNNVEQVRAGSLVIRRRIYPVLTILEVVYPGKISPEYQVIA